MSELSKAIVAGENIDPFVYYTKINPDSPLYWSANQLIASYYLNKYRDSYPLFKEKMSRFLETMRENRVTTQFYFYKLLMWEYGDYYLFEDTMRDYNRFKTEYDFYFKAAKGKSVATLAPNTTYTLEFTVGDFQSIDGAIFLFNFHLLVSAFNECRGDSFKQLYNEYSNWKANKNKDELRKSYSQVLNPIFFDKEYEYIESLKMQTPQCKGKKYALYNK